MDDKSGEDGSVTWSWERCSGGWKTVGADLTLYLWDYSEMDEILRMVEWEVRRGSVELADGKMAFVEGEKIEVVKEAKLRAEKVGSVFVGMVLDV